MDLNIYEALWQKKMETLEEIALRLTSRQEAVRTFDELFRYTPESMRSRIKILRRNTLQRIRATGVEGD